VRLGFLVVAALAVCGVVGLVAQPTHPNNADPLGQLLAPRAHARPAPANRPSIPDVMFDATSLGSPIVLDKNWRVGVTSNSEAARPDFDDSRWDLRNARESIPDVPDEDDPADKPGADPSIRPEQPPELSLSHHRPFAWFRIHVKLQPNHKPIALLIEMPVSQSTQIPIGTQQPGVDVYANGIEIQPEGPHGDLPEHYQSISRTYKLDLPPNQTDLVLVVRTIYIPFGYNAYTAFFATRTLRLGSPEDLNRSLQIWWGQTLFERFPRLIYSILLVVLAVFLIALYFNQRGHDEYRWLALHELAQAPLGFIDLAGSYAYMDQLLFGALFAQLIVISAYLYFEFIVSFLALRKRWYIKALRYSAPILALIGPTLLLIGRSHFFVLLLAGTVCLFWMLGWVLFCVITLIAATVKRNYEAGLLLIPLVLNFVGMLEPLLSSGMQDWAGHTLKSPLTVQAGLVPIHFASIADFAGLLAIVLIIFVRFMRIHRNQERAASELAAARSVQELMIPHEKLNAPGFQVDSVYNPANEVGGDFYHLEPTPDGGLLVVIGDVAGKGLKAAMNVSMLMGALRRTPEISPAKILKSLNRVLVDSESFTTCQAAWFGANGELVIANAGHLSPYLNSQEVVLPGGLPLGVLADISYEEVRLYLHPGDRILLMSDGVVEARQSSGELFGFDRVHNLSSQSAFYIADAAKEFGQEDDITVLTVRRLAQAVAA
jgi:Stage II sporulation protein E (SpoIIE)